MKRLLLVISVFLITISTYGQPVFLANLNKDLAPSYFTSGDKFYYTIKDSLFQSDGTASGTKLIKKVGADIFNASINLTINNYFFFITDEPGENVSLWKSDGTSANTTKIATYKWIQPMYVFNSELYLNVDDGIHGQELWKLNSSFTTLSLLKDIVPGSTDGNLTWEKTILNGKLYFKAGDGSGGYALWKTDGTPSGTVKAADFSFDSFYNLTAVNGTIYFSRYYYENDITVKSELWKTDGSLAGTSLVKDFGSGGVVYLTPFKNKLYFVYYTNNYYPYNSFIGTSDGTSQGTILWEDFPYTTISSVSPDHLLLYQDLNHTGSNISLFKSDGTEEGTVPFYSTSSGGIGLFTEVGKYLFFANGNGISQSNYSQENSKLIQNIFGGNYPGAYFFFAAGNKIYFYTETSNPSYLKLWAYDPTKPSNSDPYFTLVDADTDEELLWLKNNDYILLDYNKNINIKYNPGSLAGIIKSVKFKLNNSTVRTENAEPYSIGGDNNGDFSTWNYPGLGTYTLSATPYTNINGTGALAGGVLSIGFTIKDVSKSKITSFTLVNANTDTDIITITEGSTIDLSTLPANHLNIRANIDSIPASKVIFNFDGYSATETSAPYALFGDNAGNYNSGSLSVGSHTLKATPYNASNIAGKFLEINFDAINSNLRQGLGTENDNNFSGIKVMQNPSADKFAFSINTTHSGFATLEIFGLDGNKVGNIFSGIVSENETLNLKWDGENNPSGVYILKYTNNKDSVTQKLFLNK